MTSAFENRNAQGFLNWFVMTWKQAALEPFRFYRALGESPDTQSALLFYLINSAVGSLSITLLTFPFTLHFSFFSFPFSVVLWFIGLFAVSAIIHFFLKIIGGARCGFSTTLCVCAYSSAPSILPFVGWVWELILMVIGLAQAHRTRMRRSGTAVAFAFFVLMFMAWLLFASVFISILSMMH